MAEDQIVTPAWIAAVRQNYGLDTRTPQAAGEAWGTHSLVAGAITALGHALDRVEQLEKDKARLDWLEASGRSLHWNYTDGTGSRSESPRFRYAVGEARKVFPWSDHDFAGLLWRPNVREAIDAARAEGGHRV